MTSTELPLSGVRVLDVSTLFAGPLAATFLGDFGANVIKHADRELPAGHAGALGPRPPTSCTQPVQDS